MGRPIVSWDDGIDDMEGRRTSDLSPSAEFPSKGSADHILDDKTSEHTPHASRARAQTHPHMDPGAFAPNSLPPPSLPSEPETEVSGQYHLSNTLVVVVILFCAHATGVEFR